MLSKVFNPQTVDLLFLYLVLSSHILLTLTIGDLKRACVCMFFVSNGTLYRIYLTLLQMLFNAMRWP